MAELAVGGAFLSAFVKLLFDRLTSENILNLFRGKKRTVKLLDDLKTLLISANKLLNDAEEKQIRDENVKKWLDELNDVIYRADDLADSIDSEALRRKVEYGESSSNTRIKVVNKVTDVFSGFHGTVKNEATEILRRLKVLLDQKDALGLREGVDSILASQRPAAPLVEESSVYGRKEDKEKIVNLLLSSDNSGGDKISVVPIVGMGGIGKTTLAQLVYDDERVVRNFEARGWVTVSEEFDVLKITRTLFERVTSERCQISAGDDLFEVQRRLKEALKEKKFLFVLDDIWNENYHLWSSLRSSFDSAGDGSKILVTARSTAVSSVMAVGPTHHLSTLSSEDGWQLFTRHAFGNNADPNSHKELRVFGRYIVNKCKGLPLAIKSLGGLLRSERNPKKWENILKSDVWDELYKKEGNILPALWLSYRHMPTHLKRCFSYCSLFPKDFKFKKEKVILLWMAEGFLQSDNQGLTMEELGAEYFEDLLSRSMFQKSNQDESIFVMHDLIHDLAMFVSGGFCFRVDRRDENWHNKLPSQTRYLSCDMVVSKPENQGSIFKAKFLRTFIPLRPLYYSSALLSCQELLKSGRCLRVLCLSGASIEHLSGSIENLIHLRYFDLSFSKIRELPDSICRLYNLQTLILSQCRSLKALPKDMENLVNLRHLDLEGVSLIKQPVQLCKVKSLQSSSYVVIASDRNTEPKLKMLKEVQPLCGKLEILRIENLADAKEASEADLKHKEGITDLNLRWSSSSGSKARDDMAKEVLDTLQPRASLLRSLMIEFYRGTVFSDWVSHDSYSNMASIHLKDCKSCLFLPPLGNLPALKELEISGFDCLTSIGDEFFGNSNLAFRSLEKFRISNMQKWNEWSLGVFPCLTYLKLAGCPKLAKIIFPENLPPLIRLNTTYFSALESLLEQILPQCSNLKWLSLWQCGKLFKQGYNLHEFASLNHLCFSEWNGDSFPEEGKLLPASLTSVRIWNCNNLLALDRKAFQGLKSLKSLHIYDCPKLRCLPEEGLPGSLSYLSIVNCPLLEKRCEKDKGKDWTKIAHVASVDIFRGKEKWVF